MNQSLTRHRRVVRRHIVAKSHGEAGSRRPTFEPEFVSASQTVPGAEAAQLPRYLQQRRSFD